MIQVTETQTLVLIIGAGSLAFGAVNQLAKWGVESLKSRNSSANPASRSFNGKGFSPECEVLLKQTHGLAISTDRKLEATAILLDSRLEALLEQGREQIQATREVGSKIEERSTRRG